MEENGTYSWTPDDQPKPPKKKLSFEGLTRRIGAVVIVLILFSLAGICFYTVDDK